MEGTFAQFVAAARRSSSAVLSAIDCATRAAEPELDAALFFASDESVLSCVYARGPRTEHFRSVRMRHAADGRLPARAAIVAQAVVSSRRLDALMPGDRAAIAVPMISERAVRGVWYAATATAAGLPNAQRVTRIVASATEIYLLALEREADRADATFDGLTGALSPRAFRLRLHDVMRSTSGAVLSLWFVDTDRFKEINDAYGHEAGDLVLQRMAALLGEHAVPGVDVVGRKGGDEFCMLLHGSRKLRAIERARAFCAAVRTHDFGVPMQLTASIGVAAFPFDAGDAAALLETADAAMYHAKRCGRDRVAYAVEGAGFALYE
ncbi:MAG TPA: GGDEF domain-containing protein [Candidatus Dormibacteraeota bacterium]|nr:GGDEF domain-containing protein [Candidatus Dormibacteraeota bacterium]